MSIVAQVSNIMQELFHSSVNQKVQELGIVQRIRKLPYNLFIQTLVCGWFEKPDASYADLANTAQDLGVHISRQAIAKRMTPDNAEILKSTLEVAATQVLTARTQYLPMLDQFTGVYYIYKTALGSHCQMNFTQYMKVHATRANALNPL